jgi:uncharacterized protein (DUF2236 family)
MLPHGFLVEDLQCVHIPNMEEIDQVLLWLNSLRHLHLPQLTTTRLLIRLPLLLKRTAATSRRRFLHCPLRVDQHRLHQALMHVTRTRHPLLPHQIPLHPVLLRSLC